ncbi:unnamed protein product [Diplocarpon coronariae]
MDSINPDGQHETMMAAFRAVTSHFPLPGSPGAPHFTGANITDFLEQYEETCYDFGIVQEDMISRLPRYCDHTSKDIIKSLPEWKTHGSWELLVKALKSEFREFDRQQIRDTLAFLKEFVLVTRTPKELKNYCRTFTRVSNTLISQKILSEVERGRLFLLGLPTGLRNKIIKHFRIDEQDPVTFASFEEFSAFALKSDLSERTIDAMEQEKAPTPSYTKDLKSLVQEHSKALEVTEEAKKNPVVIPFTRGPDPGVRSNPRIEELETQFAELRIQSLETRINDLLQEKQHVPQFGNRQNSATTSQPSGSCYQTPASRHSEQPANIRTQQLAEEGGIDPNQHSANINAIGYQGNGNGRRLTCNFCNNEEPNCAPHEYRNDCPLFLRFIDTGVMHVNKYGMLCIGDPRPEAIPVKKHQNRSWLQTVRTMTCGTKWDENLVERQRVIDMNAKIPTYVYTGPTSNLPEGVLKDPASDQTATEVRGISVLGWVNNNVSADINAASVSRNPRNTRRPSRSTTPPILTKPAKVQKSTRATRESQYGVQTLKDTQQSGTAVDEDEADMADELIRDVMDEDGSELEDQEVEVIARTPDPKRKRQMLKREKFVDKYASSTAMEKAVENVMAQQINLTFKDLFGLTGRFDKVLGKHIPVASKDLNDDEEMEIVTRKNSEKHPALIKCLQIAEDEGTQRYYDIMAMALTSQNINRNCSAVAMKSPVVVCSVEESVKAKALIDCGSEVNAMTRKVAEMARLTIVSDRLLVYSTVSGSKHNFDGWVKNVKVRVGGIVNYTDFLVMENSSNDILLGMPFILESQLTFNYPGDGLMKASLWNTDRSLEGQMVVAGDVAEFQNEVSGND